MKRVIGIGNALVDIMVKIPGEELLKEFNMPKGSMQLVDAERSEQVKRGTGNLARSVSSGGSVANTIHALAILGARPGYIGSTGTDELGEYFVNDLLAAGADPVIFRRSCATGTAVALVTPDSERTFATYLGAAV
ncbi:MAG: adenosine kinase, partial [Bacteroidetes bacterium]|nr:adenosine kinase [Bacteroidota bacterium]